MGASTASRSSSQRSRGNDGDQSLNVVEASIAELRVAGAICLGLTNMPPTANGGMRRGLYGRAESPYNSEYLTAAFASGSSNRSGTATAASFAAFGLGEET